MKRSKPKLKPKPVVELHLRLWDARLGSFVIEQAHQQRRTKGQQIVYMLDRAMMVLQEGADAR